MNRSRFFLSCIEGCLLVLNTAVFAQTLADEAYRLIIANSLNNHLTGIQSGWLLDNRGGVPLSFATGNGGALTDISITEGTALIREFNKIETGTLVMDADFSLISDIDGAYIEYRNEEGDAVYHLEVKDGQFCLADINGGYTSLPKKAETGKRYFRISLDMDKGTAQTMIDGELCGTSSLLQTDSQRNVVNLRFGTTEESTASVRLHTVHACVNYALYEDFSYSPVQWDFQNAAVSGGVLKIEPKGNAAHSFAPVTDKVIVETSLFLDSKTRLSYRLTDDSKTVAVLSAEGTDLLLNGQNIYSCYDGLWYRLRFELDFFTESILAKVNGRKVAVVPFRDSASGIASIRITNQSQNTLQADDIKIFRTYNEKRADYVPVPVIPADPKGYNVGINVCSLWQEGTHWGWATVSPHESLVLGYYDEGIPETADWEIKYMVEHGIDFQAFCWYADQSSTFLKSQPLSAQLHDAYMNARYSEAMNYCLIWECANAARPASLDDFKKYFVPYFIENYFKDPRYMKIENRLVFCIFSPGSLTAQNSLKSAEVVRQAFDYMEQEVRKLGFDGVIYMGCNSDKSTVTQLGMDATYGYNWGTEGYRLDVNKTNNLNKAKENDDAFYTVPTISVGFNNIAWAGTRHPMMSVEDFKAAQEWVRDTYLPEYAQKGTWQEKLVMISTWNEYGEGTYLMPGEHNGGFGYLDALRDVYTAEEADLKLDQIPGKEQLRRINRMYPQYRRLIRSSGYAQLKEAEEIDPSKYETVVKLDITKMKDLECSAERLTGFKVDEKGASGTSTHFDAYFFPAMPPGSIDLSNICALRIREQIPAGETTEIFFVTEKSREWTQNKSCHFTSTTGEMKDYIVRLDRKVWTGNLTQIRVDPCNAKDKSFRVKSVEFLTDNQPFSTEVSVNGLPFVLFVPPVTMKNGDVLIAFDPASALDQRLNSFCEWTYDTRKLSIHANGHTVVFTMDKDDYFADGIKKHLDYPVYMDDGLPMLPIARLCADLGYLCKIKGNTVEIKTHRWGYVKKM